MWIRVAEIMLSLTTRWIPNAVPRSLMPIVSARRRDGALSVNDAQLHAPAQEELGVEVAEQQIGVGDGRLGAAQAIARRAGVSAARCPGRL